MLSRAGVGIAVFVSLHCLLAYSLIGASSVQPTPAQFSEPANSPQCAHWCVQRASQELGMPISMNELLAKLPPRPEGHTFEEIARLLAELGLVTEARAETEQSLVKRDFPCIVDIHPNHYIVLLGISEGVVSIYDVNGSRSGHPATDLRKSWKGHALWIRTPEKPAPLPIARATHADESGLIQFDSLVQTTTELFKSSDQTEFTFNFRNLGNHPLIIKNVTTSCDCLAHQFPAEPIEPLGTGSITFAYRSAGTLQNFSHNATVITDDVTLPRVTLEMRGVVEENLKINPPRIILREAIAGESTAQTTFVTRQADDSRFDLRFIGCSDPRISVQVLPLSDARARKFLPGTDTPLTFHAAGFSVEATVTPGSYDAGVIQAIARFAVDGMRQKEIEIPIAAKILPAVRLEPSVLVLDEQSATSGNVPLRLVTKLTQLSIEHVEPALAGMEWELSTESGVTTLGRRFDSAVFTSPPTGDVVVTVRSATGAEPYEIKLPVLVRKRKVQGG